MWRLGNCAGQFVDQVFDDDGNHVAQVYGMPPLDFWNVRGADNLVNAALIASAPAMFLYICRQAETDPEAQRLLEAMTHYRIQHTDDDKLSLEENRRAFYAKLVEAMDRERRKARLEQQVGSVDVDTE